MTTFVCLFYLYPHVTRKRRCHGGAIFWTNPNPLKSCPFPSFPVISLTSYHWICCLFEATKQRS